jgi:hypothetical protein
MGALFVVEGTGSVFGFFARKILLRLGAFCFAAGPPLLPVVMEPGGSAILHSA